MPKYALTRDMRFSTEQVFSVAADVDSRWTVLEMNIDESKIRAMRSQEVADLLAVHRRAGHHVPGHLDLSFKLHGEQHLVLDDHDFQFSFS